MKIKLFTLFVLTLSMLSCNSQTSKNIKIVNVETFKKGISVKNVQLIDVRTAEEYAEGFIPKAINIDVSQEDFKEKIKTLDKTKPVYVYCTKGVRSNNAAQILEKAGFKKIIDLEGGYSNWK